MKVDYSNDKKIAYFNDKRFVRDEHTGYYLSSNKIGDRRLRLHVYVWMYHNGEIPKGYQIHHKDENKYHNDIDNLECLTEHEHLSHHSSKPERKAQSLKYMKRAQEAAKEWHASKAGYEWHKEHYEQVKDKLHVPMEFTCEYCGKVFISTNAGSKFCCNAHKTAARNKSGVDNIEVNCVMCGKSFVKNKYSKTQTCSRKCGGALKSANHARAVS